MRLSFFKGFRALISFVFLFSFFQTPVPARAAFPVHAQARVTSEKKGLNASGKSTLGIMLEIENGWHIYWKNPGDTGFPPKLKLLSGPALRLGEIEFPVPERFEAASLGGFGYEGNVLLPFTVEPSAPLAGGKKETLSFELKLLVCKDVCVPEKTNIQIELPVLKDGENGPGAEASLFSAARRKIPLEDPTWRIQASSREGRLVLSATPGKNTAGTLQAFHADRVFFETPGLIQYNVSPIVRVRDGKSYELAFPLKEGASLPAAVSVVINLDRPLRWQATLSPAAAAPLNALSEEGTVAEVLRMVIFAFLGGLILNLMPCVFPVLSIKLLGIVHEAGAGRRRVRINGLFYTLGVVVSFWALLAILLGFQRAGSQIGWGFQLQIPGFVAFLIFLFFLMGLNLLGVFEIGTKLMSLGGRLKDGGGKEGALMTGVLSVVVASPCTAPFMGVALGFALSQSAAAGFLIFTGMGLGLAFPFLLVTFFPSLASRLPKPGVWMRSLKMLLAFPLFGTVAWLLWVLQIQAGSRALLFNLLGLVAVGMASWIYGDWVQTGRTRKVQRAGAASAIVIFLLGTGLAFSALKAGEKGLVWEPYSETRLGELRGRSIPVLVDYTAAWCITCQVNEKWAFESDAVTRKLKESGVATLRADWTTEDPRITDSLRKFGRSGVPLYVLYGKDGKAAPRILPQVLTPGILLDALEHL